MIALPISSAGISRSKLRNISSSTDSASWRFSAAGMGRLAQAASMPWRIRWRSKACLEPSRFMTIMRDAVSTRS